MIVGDPEWVVSHVPARDGHPHARFDPSKRVVERALEIGGHRFRCSPDITHMLLEGHSGLYEHGIEAICDPNLPPNSLVAVA